MKNLIQEVSENYVNDVITDIVKQVKINSVRDDENPVVQGPFGLGIKQSLVLFVEQAKNLNMRTFIDPEGYYAYAEVGSGDDLVGIVGHLDVVPAGDLTQWTLAGAFSGEIIDDKIIGRGTQDDKGPVIINMHALKLICDLGVKLTKRVRIIVGTSEETTWECIKKYKENEEIPTMSYTPDASFPLIYAEKTIIRSNVLNTNKDALNFEIKADGAYNAVCDKVCIVYSNINDIIDKLNNFESLISDYKQISETEIEIYGVSAHSMECFKGKNALLVACLILDEIGIKNNIVNFIAKMYDYHGFKMFGNIEDEITGKLTVNIGLCNLNNESQIFGIDIRVPVLCDDNKLEADLISLLKTYNLEYEVCKKTEKLYVEKDSKLVSKLYSSYQEITNDYNTPLQTSGGGTYARAFDNCVAFGHWLEATQMQCNIHQPNEFIEIKYLKTIIEIYALAITKLLDK